MKPLTLVVLALVLSFPALHGLATGTVEVDEAGLRILLAVGAAVVIDRLSGAFMNAVAPRPDAEEEPPPQRRRTDR